MESNNGSGPILDVGYSPLNDGFEWGRIDFNVIAAGTTTLTGEPGFEPCGIINGSSCVDATFTTVTIKSRPNFVLGDINCDGSVDLLDVGPFVDLLLSGQFEPKADINQDGAVDLLDVASLIDLLSGG